MLVREKLERADELPRPLSDALLPGSLKHAVAPNDRMLDAILDKPGIRLARPQLLAGLARFREEKRDHYESLFAQLADGQQPHTMFITCADSRVDPALLMGSHPGDLFVVRAIGALVAPCGFEALPQEGAAVEYGVGVLGVRTIVVCGHSKCGAISALKKGKVPEELTTLKVWSKQVATVAGDVASFPDADEATRAVTVRQIENLLSYPLVRAKHEKGELQIHAWFYDLGEVELFEWDPARKAFLVLGAEPRPLSIPPLAAGAEAE
jgi:carbonic anhydrase